MQGVSLLAISVTTVAALVFSSAWYIVFGKARMKLLGNKSASAEMMRVPVSQRLFEVVRSLVVVLVVAHFLALAGVHGWLNSVELGAWLGVFPVMILVGAALWDKRPWKLVAIHGGDWLLKILLVAFLLGLWR